MEHSDPDKVMNQVAPWPDALAYLVPRLRYRDGWTFTLANIPRGQFSSGLTLVIDVRTTNSYPPHEPITVRHYMPVPPAAYDARTWRRWLLDQCLLVDRHEGCEFFTIDGDKPYAPHHGPGENPYEIFELGTDLDRRTSSRGVLDE